MSNMTNGFIYKIFYWLIEKSRYLNLIEYFKYAGSLLSRERGPSAKRHTYVANAVDIYILLKWILLVVLWECKIADLWACILTWYLIVGNLHTFLYYFLWKHEPSIDHDRSKKRFIKLILAIFFSDFCFAYLYDMHYHAAFDWGKGFWLPEQSIWFSISNSVAGNYDKVKPLTETGYTISMLQYMITFFYVGVLISKAMPQKPAPNHN